jgi:toxin YoeB
MRERRWADDAWADYVYWRKHDAGLCARIDRLLASIDGNPEGGLGKPKPLRGELTGWWSRRITLEHRLVYRVDAKAIYVLQCRYHY